MSQDPSYKKLFDLMPEAAPEERLAAAISSRIAHARAVRIRVRMSIHAALTVSAVAAIVPAVQAFISSAETSGFSEYVSLIVSDGSHIASSWKAFGLALAESAPILETSLILGLCLIAANSLRRGARYFYASHYSLA